MKIWRILFGSNYIYYESKILGKWMVNRFEKVQRVLYVVIIIYYGFHSSTLIVQFKRFNFII